MKMYRRHENAGAAAAPAEEGLKSGAVAGAIIVVTLLSKATTDLYDATKSGIKKGWSWCCSLFQPADQSNSAKTEKS